MIETKEETYHGVWYLPDSDSRKLQGYVLLTDFTVSLHLTDPHDRNLEEKGNRQIDELKYPVIHGIGRYGEKITLYECRGISDHFEAKLMLYGDSHYSSFHNQKFRILGVHIPLFDSWISNQSFRMENCNSGFSINYNPPEEITFELNEHVSLNIQFECFPPSTENRNKLTLHHFALVQFVSTSEEGMAFAELFKYLRYFQQLVSFLARDGANISTARVYPSIENFKRDKFLGTMIYGALPFNKFQYDDFHWKYLVQKSDILPNIESFFKNWFVFASTVKKS